MKKITVPKAVKGKAFAAENYGLWAVLGSVDDGETNPYIRPEWMKGKRLQSFGPRAYLCEITIKPVLDSKGRPITRVKKASKS